MGPHVPTQQRVTEPQGGAACGAQRLLERSRLFSADTDKGPTRLPWNVGQPAGLQAPRTGTMPPARQQVTARGRPSVGSGEPAPPWHRLPSGHRPHSGRQPLGAGRRGLVRGLARKARRRKAARLARDTRGQKRRRAPAPAVNSGNLSPRGGSSGARERAWGMRLGISES